jgi:hypothetical protein
MDIEPLIHWMEPLVDTTFVAPRFDPAIADEALPSAGRGEVAHRRLLAQWNGFYALGGLLHVFGACDAPPNHSLRAWNRLDGWRAAWGRQTEGLTFFAEDAFGDQFAYRNGKVVRFRALVGGIAAMQSTIDEWLEAVLLDPGYMLHQRVFDECVRRYGPLPRGGHFVPIGPVGEDQVIDPANCQVMPARDSMEMKAAAPPRMIRRASSMRIPKA